MTSANDRRRTSRLDRLGQGYLRGLTALVDFSRRRAPWVLAAALALTAACIYYSATHFAISTDTSDMLSRDLPFQRLQKQFDQAFPQLSDTILIVVEGDTAETARIGADRLAGWLKTRGRAIASVYQPGGGEFFRKNGLLYLDTKDLWALSDRLSEAQPLLARLAQDPSVPGFVSLLGEALTQETRGGPRLTGLGRIFDELDKTLTAQEAGRFYQLPWGDLMAGPSAFGEGNRSFLIVKPRYDFRDIQPVETALRSIHRGAAALQLDSAHGLRVRVTGSAALDNEQFQAVSRGAGVATALSVSLVLVLLVLALHSPRLVFISLATLFMGLSWTAAFALLATGPLNLISVAFAVLFVGLGVDFGIQFTMRYREESAGADHARALRRTAHGVGGALSLAAAAAAISFYSFVPTSYAGIVDLGLISGTSMFIALFANLTVLPALLTLMGAGRPARRHIRPPLPLARLPIHRYGRVIAAAAALVAVATIPLIMAARFDFDPMHLQNQNSEAVRTFQDLLKHSTTSPYPIDILEPDLKSAQQVARRLEKLKTVAHAVTLASYVPEHQSQKLGIIQEMSLVVPPFALRPEQAPATPAADIRAALERFRGELEAYVRQGRDPGLDAPARRLAADLGRYLQRYGQSPEGLVALQARIIGTLPEQLQNLQLSLTAGPVTLKTLPASLRERYLAADGRARVEVFSSLDLNQNHDMRRFVAEVQRVAPNAIGTPVMLVQGGDAVVQAFREATVISLVLITGLLLLTLRNLADTLVVLIPLALAAMLTVAAMELLGIPFNLANIIVLPLLIGLGVAFAIYLVMRWRTGVAIANLLQTSTPEAVLFSALTTMSSFGSLAVSPDPGMATLGKTLSIALTAVLLAILILLPALLMLRTPSPREGEPAAGARE